MLRITIISADHHLSGSLEDVTRDVLTELKLDATFTKQDTLTVDAGTLVLEPPALLVNGKIVSFGKIPSSSWLADQISGCIKTAQAS